MKLTDPHEIARQTRATVAAVLTRVISSRGDLETGSSEAVALERSARAEPLPTGGPSLAFKASRVVEPVPGSRTGRADEAPRSSETSRLYPLSSNHKPRDRSGLPRIPPNTAPGNESAAALRLRDGFLDRVETFVAALALWGAKLNLTSAPDDPAEIAFHILDSLAPLILARMLDTSPSAALPLPGAALQPEVPDAIAKPTPSCSIGEASWMETFDAGSQVLDLGSGAGFPALILAAACNAEFVLLEGRRKRASFLSVTAAEMGLSNAQVNSSRTEALHLHPVFDLVSARAFAEPAIVFDTARVALKPGGRVILYASPAQRAAIDLAATHWFEPAVFLEYEVPRGAIRVAHLLAVAQRIA